LSNAFPELADGAGLGAQFKLRSVPLEESGMSPAEIWCNESQERYVLAIDAKDLELFKSFCERERCPFAVVGEATASVNCDYMMPNNPLTQMMPCQLICLWKSCLANRHACIEM
jgi:phosphoribosylformylglycinamidine (FGAM) synthase-like enzyme